MEPDSPDIPEFSVDIVPQFGTIPPRHEDGDYYSLSPLDQVTCDADSDMIEQECKTSQTISSKLEPLLQQEALLPFTIKPEPAEPDSNNSMSPSLIKVKEEDSDDGEIRASNPQDITMWSSTMPTRTPQLSHLVAKVKEENPSCGDINMQIKSIGVSSFATTMENSTDTPKVTDKAQCLVCGEHFANIMQYTHHRNMHLRSHEQPVKIKNECIEQLHECLNCLQTFPHESDLTAHKINCRELHKCGKCGKKWESENKLEMHMKYMCKIRMLDHYQKGSFICRFCKKSFLSKWMLTDHIDAVHHKKKPFSCNLCEKTFARKTHLKGHIKSVHDKLKPFSCTLCEKSFSQKGHLAVHVRIVHEKLKPFSCTFCDKSFSQSGSLTAHVDGVHRKIKPFTCTLCNKSFGRNDYLTKHIKVVHEGMNKVKPFSCTLCEKSFSQKGHLTTHVRTVHENLKPFSCTLCDKSFAQNSNLTKHINVVHRKLKPLSCTLCDKSFASNTQLILHVDRVHNAVDFYQSLGMSTKSETEQDDSNI